MRCRLESSLCGLTNEVSRSRVAGGATANPMTAATGTTHIIFGFQNQNRYSVEGTAAIQILRVQAKRMATLTE